VSLGKSSNPVVLRRGVGIGTGNAETDDEFLFECFVEYPPVEACRKPESPVMIVAGRTGSGKTAILRYLENEGSPSHTTSIDPFEMSMSYVSNSDPLRFLQAIGADIDLLFQVLWKHVLCIEFIRMRWGVDNTEKSLNVFQKIIDKFGKEDRRKKSLNYLRDWEGRFWITMDENIKDLTEKIESKINAEIGGEVQKFKAGGQYDKRISREKKVEIIDRTKKIISSEQLAELHGIIDMLSFPEHADGSKTFYIFIDQLDEKWVDDKIRFRMIKGLIESLKSFRKIHNLKILVALREDVIERVVQETADISFQREKFESLMTRLHWTKSELRQLVDKRINALFKRQYTSNSIGFYDVFPEKVGAKPSLDWMLERTLMRPRDIIAFVNSAIDQSNSHATVSVSSLRKAEVDFSRKRRDALLQEWQSAFPTLEDMLNFAMSERKVGIEVLSLLGKIDDFCLQVCSSSKRQKDPIYEYCDLYVERKLKDPLVILCEIVSVLYRTGAISVKLTSQDRFIYAKTDQPIIMPHLISVDTKIRLHPMLHAAYNMQER